VECEREVGVPRVPQIVKAVKVLLDDIILPARK
jgi:hypothetical protein